MTAGNVYHHAGVTPSVIRPAGGYTAWNGNAWSQSIGHSYNSTTGRVSAGQQRVQVQNVYTGNFSYAGRRSATSPAIGLNTPSRPNATTLGRPNTTTPTLGAGTHTSYFSTPNGNIYRNTGNGWQQSQKGRWTPVQDPKVVQTLQTQQWAQQAGDQRSAAPTWSAPGSANFHAGTTARPTTGNTWNGGQFTSPRSNLGSFRSSNTTEQRATPPSNSSNSAQRGTNSGNSNYGGNGGGGNYGSRGGGGGGNNGGNGGRGGGGGNNGNSRNGH